MAEAVLSPILTSLSGSLGNFVFRRTKNGTVVSNAPPARVFTPSAQQQIVQTILSTVAKAWKTGSDAQRAAWNAYAATYFPHDRDGVGAGPGGQAVFLKANFYRQAAGLAILLPAPTHGPAAAPSGMTVALADDETTLKVVVTHAVAVVTGYRLFVESTPALISAARKPYPKDYGAAAGISALSIPVLAASGQTYTITPLRHELTEGDRFGLRLTILTPEGAPSSAFVGVGVQHLV